MATTVFPGAYYVSTPTVLSDTNETTCYTCPTGKTAHVQQITAADTAGNARTLTIKATKGGTQYTLTYQEAIAANTPMDKRYAPLVLAAADVIKCTASAATIHVMINVYEYAEPGS
jgi:hypothetical protein